MAVYGRELTSYQTLLSPSGCFSACSAFQRNISETFCICSIFTELFPPSLVNLLLCWLVCPPVQQVILHADYEGKLRLVFKQGWGAGENDALKNAFLPATWHGCLGSRFTRKSFPNTAVPVFITALMPTAPMVLVLLICFLKYCNEQTVAQL